MSLTFSDRKAKIVKTYYCGYLLSLTLREDRTHYLILKF